MLLSLVRPARRAPAIPPGRRVYAIGDIHGRLDLFERLLERLAFDHAGREPAAAELVLLGDYIDRGPQSAQLLDRLYVGPPDWCDWVTLRGNHEQVLLDILEERDDALLRLDGWLRYGGREALRSYGMPASLAYSDDLEAILAEIPSLIPPSHEALIRSMPLCHTVGDYFFVHAGVRPGIPLDSQDERDLLWIRQEFLNSREDHGAVVVHGHTISREPDLRSNRIGIDTGAYASGRLTALALEGESRRIISTGDEEDEPDEA